MINASIPLSVRPAQIENPVESYGRVLQLKQLAQQGKMQDLQIQAAEQEMAEQTILRDAYGAAGGDLEKMKTAVAGKVSPKTIMALDKAILDRRQTLASIGDKELGIARTKTDALSGAAQGLLLQPADQQPALWGQVRDALIRSGHATGDDLPEQFPGVDWLQTRTLMVGNSKAALDAEYKRREEARAAELHAPKLQEAQAGATLKTAEAAGRAPIQPYQQRQLDQATQRITSEAIGRTETARHNRAMEATAARRADAAAAGGIVNLPSGAGNGALNPAVLEQLSPGMRNIVQQIAEYRYPIPTSGVALRTPYWQNILQAVAAYDPTFDASQYSVRMGVRKDFTAGKSAQNVTRLNTVLGHLDSLKAAAEKLNNIGLTKVNTVKNWALSNTGDPRVKNFNLAANAVESELANVFKGTGATDQEIKAWRDNLDASQSKEQLQGAIDSAIELLGSRMMALQDQYEKGMGKPKGFRFLNDKSRKILTKLGKDPDTMDAIGAAQASAGTPAPAQPQSKPPLSAFER